MSLNAKRIIVGLLSFAFLATLIIVAWVEGLKQRVDPRPEPVLIGVNKACYDCHKQKSPAITEQWNDSRHARMGVGCYDCHKAQEGRARRLEPRGAADLHAGDPQGLRQVPQRHRGRVPGEPPRQGRQDPRLAGQRAGRDHRGDARGQLRLPAVPRLEDRAEEGPRRQGHARHRRASRSIDDATWPNSGIGRLNLDGSNGHLLGLPLAPPLLHRDGPPPDNCGKCHLGPDHPQKEIYDESKHGIAFVTADQQGKMHLSDKPWVVGVDLQRRPHLRHLPHERHPQPAGDPRPGQAHQLDPAPGRLQATGGVGGQAAKA